MIADLFQARQGRKDKTATPNAAGGIDLAEAVGADLSVMERDAAKIREGGPTVFGSVKHGNGVDHIVNLIISSWKASGAYETSLERWKSGTPRNSGSV